MEMAENMLQDGMCKECRDVKQDPKGYEVPPRKRGREETMFKPKHKTAFHHPKTLARKIRGIRGENEPT